MDAEADGYGTKLRTRDAKEFWPKEWSGDSKSMPFRRFTADLESYLDVLLLAMNGKGLLQWIGKQPGKKIPEGKLDEAAEAANITRTTLVEVSATMGAMLDKQRGDCSKIQQIGGRWYISVPQTGVSLLRPVSSGLVHLDELDRQSGKGCEYTGSR